jgi:hypothetical protein
VENVSFSIPGPRSYHLQESATMKAVVGQAPPDGQDEWHTSPSERPPPISRAKRENWSSSQLPILTLFMIVLLLFCFVNTEHGFTLVIVSNFSVSSRTSGELNGSSGPRVAPLMEDTSLTAALSAIGWGSSRSCADSVARGGWARSTTCGRFGGLSVVLLFYLPVSAATRWHWEHNQDSTPGCVSRRGRR